MSIRVQGTTVIDDSRNVSGVNVSVTGTISDSLGGIRDIPINNKSTSYVLTLSDSGKVISTTSSVTVPSSTFFSGNSVAVFNSSGGSISIIQDSGVTCYFAGTSQTGTRSLPQKGLATILCVSPNAFVISGSGLV